MLSVDCVEGVEEGGGISVDVTGVGVPGPPVPSEKSQDFSTLSDAYQHKTLTLVFTTL